MGFFPCTLVVSLEKAHFNEKSISLFFWVCFFFGVVQVEGPNTVLLQRVVVFNRLPLQPNNVLFFIAVFLTA